MLLPGESQGWGNLVATVYGVAQSRTRLKRLSSSSSILVIYTEESPSSRAFHHLMALNLLCLSMKTVPMTPAEGLRSLPGFPPPRRLQSSAPLVSCWLPPLTPAEFSTSRFLPSCKRLCSNEDSVQFSSVAQLCLTLFDPMNRSTPGLPVNTNSQSSLRLTSIESVFGTSLLFHVQF